MGGNKRYSLLLSYSLGAEENRVLVIFQRVNLFKLSLSSKEFHRAIFLGFNFSDLVRTYNVNERASSFFIRADYSQQN